MGKVVAAAKSAKKVRNLGMIQNAKDAVKGVVVNAAKAAGSAALAAGKKSVADAIRGRRLGMMGNAANAVKGVVKDAAKAAGAAAVTAARTSVANAIAPSRRLGMIRDAASAAAAKAKQVAIDAAK